MAGHTDQANVIWEPRGNLELSLGLKSHSRTMWGPGIFTGPLSLYFVKI